MTSKQLINFKLSVGSYKNFIDELIRLGKAKSSVVTCVANVHMFVEAQKDPAFLSIVNNADIVTPDGMPMTWALRFLYGIKQDRVAGMTLLPDLLAEMECQKMSVFFYGGTQAMLDQTKSYIQQQYPNVKIAGLLSPPFRKLTDKEQTEINNRIAEANADIVFAILGCPKQEKWMASAKGTIKSVMIGVGGSLPVMIGLQKRAPLWMQKAGFEWLFRLLQEPTRLFKRYAVTNTYFIIAVVKELIKVKFFKPSTSLIK